jgi:hypothetical protein
MSKWKEVRLCSKRSWLNPKDSSDTGAIQSYGCIEGEEGKQFFDGGLSIWDCGRKISLDLSADCVRKADQRIRKLDIIIEHCEQMKFALEFTRSKMK